MSDRDEINPHTGKPYPPDPEPAASPYAPGGQTSASAGAPAAPAPDAAPAAPTSAGAPAATGSTPAAAPSQQEMAVRSALETVMDPEIGLSVIDLGLIREIAITPGKTLIRMMLTTPFCPYAPQMVADVKAAAQSVVPQDCDVDLMPDPWSPELMPDPSLLGYSF
ncbi:MAG: metal-sulfur cluster assembly factor [Candidatus Eisenbacteria bacterium]